MRVKQLKINSFRGINDLTLEFPEDEPTVFIGDNGVGKSSILDCLAILFSPFIELIRFNPEYVENLHLINLEKSFRDLDIKKGSKQTRNEIVISIDSSKDLTWFLTNVPQKRTEYIDIASLQKLKAFGAEIYQQIQIVPGTNIPLIIHYPVNRAVLDIPLEVSEDVSYENSLNEKTNAEPPLITDDPSRFEKLFYPFDLNRQTAAYKHALSEQRIGFGSFFQWFRNWEDLENEERRDNPDYRDRQLEAVREAISSLMPEFSNLRVRRSPLRMTVKKQGEELIINQLSDGEKCLLAMVGDLARRLAIANPGLENPLQGSGVVLIDEIELHLHPKWQREIIPALTRTFPNCQFIITTHSPQVVSHVKPEGIYILKATPEGITATHPASSYGRDSNRILEDLMEVPKRPQEIKDRLLELFRLIDNKDLDGAKKLRYQIAEEIGYDEPELMRADVSIRRREILNK